jgi:molybdopterin/thiamine biosynthesis adenylyltransferase
VDMIFCCTDNLSSRLVLNRLAFQYLISLIDLGIDIECSEEGKIRTAGGVC